MSSILVLSYPRSRNIRREVSMICWRSRAFLRSRRPIAGTFPEAGTPRLAVAASASALLMVTGAARSDRPTPVFTGHIMRSPWYAALGAWHTFDSDPNIIVTNAKLQVLRRSAITSENSSHRSAARSHCRTVGAQSGATGATIDDGIGPHRGALIFRYGGEGGIRTPDPGFARITA